MADRPPRPNVVTIILDDLGFAQLGCFGADIATPNIDRLAAAGLRYNRFHVTALCSPTRACILTGRNHHAVGCGFLVDVPLDLPGYHAHFPPSAATMPTVLREHDYATIAVGKWHLTPTGERSHAGPFTQWPLGVGFESYYGFLQGDTNQWTPNLIRDNHYIDPPRSPDEGYHLTEDLADVAIRQIIDRRQAAPGKPFYLYVGLGATHAPHQVPREWSDAYRGRFDDGWDEWRERAFARQLELGVVPPGTRLTERPSWVPAWDELDPEARRLFARMHEVYAGFVSHTDAQIGRLIDSLEQQGVLDDTIVMVLSDNGASAEGGQLGTFNEHRFSHRIGESVDRNAEYLDDWGGTRTYSHYAWGWAWAGNTPFRLWKRYTWLGGTRTPLVVHWPNGMAARGEVRDQFCHAVDLMPTILDACGIEAPAVHHGVDQQRIDGASLLPTFDDAEAAAPRTTQYFEMVGSRSIVLDDWKATTDHVTTGVADEERLMEGSRDFDQDRWALFDLSKDFSESDDVAADHPEVLARLIATWDQEAERNHVLPLEDSLTGRLAHLIRPRFPPAQRSVFRPGGSPIRDESVPRLFAGGTVTATVDADEGADGVLCAIGDWTGGFAMYVSDSRLTVGMTIGGDQVVIVADRDIPPGRHDLSCELTPADGVMELRLRHDGVEVGSGLTPHGVPATWQHGGTALCLGHDQGFPVVDRYTPPFPWTGVLHEIVVESAFSMPSSSRPGEALRTALHAD